MIGRVAAAAIFAGIGGAAGLASLSALTKSFNPQGNYTLAVLFSGIAFAITVASIVVALVLARPTIFHRISLLGFVGMICAGLVGGAIFPWGTFGLYLAFGFTALVTALSVNGFSTLALANFLGALGGFIGGWVVSMSWVVAISFWNPSLLNSPPMAVWVPFGLTSYGFALGLLLSLSER